MSRAGPGPNREAPLRLTRRRLDELVGQAEPSKKVWHQGPHRVLVLFAKRGTDYERFRVFGEMLNDYWFNF